MVLYFNLLQIMTKHNNINSKTTRLNNYLTSAFPFRSTTNRGMIRYNDGIHIRSTPVARIHKRVKADNFLQIAIEMFTM
jgi:hypothetical protein